MQIKGNTFIITGGASGLGEATVAFFRSKGANVAVFDLNAERGEQMEKDDSKGLIYRQVDITSEEQVQAGIDDAQKKWNKPLSGVINCGGVASAGKLVGRDNEPLDLETFKFVIDVNVIGTINVCRLVAAHIVNNHPPISKDSPVTEDRGVIVNVASVAAYDGQEGQAAYAASKGAIASLTLPLARDLARFGLRIVTIAPGLFETSMSSHMPDKTRKSIETKTLEFPRRLGEPKEFAHLAASLVENTYINGEVIRLDGAARLGKL